MTKLFDYLKSDAVKRTTIVSILLCWCASMIVVRMERTGSGYYRFLLGNLFLALVPLFLSTGLRIAHRLQLNLVIKIGIFSLWLLFLPNAPYILTDILHLTRASQAPAWYDLALLLSCSGTGLLIGYLSLMDVQTIVERNFNPIIGWTFAVVSLVLSGFGIYLGRFLRWNSWDVLTSPMLVLQLLNGLTHPFADARPLSVTFIFGVILALAYISVRLLLVSTNGNQEKV
jgi:uncharacterized membrane protein